MRPVLASSRASASCAVLPAQRRNGYSFDEVLREDDFLPGDLAEAAQRLRQAVASRYRSEGSGGAFPARALTAATERHTRATSAQQFFFRSHTGNDTFQVNAPACGSSFRSDLKARTALRIDAVAVVVADVFQ